MTSSKQVDQEFEYDFATFAEYPTETLTAASLRIGLGGEYAEAHERNEAFEASYADESALFSSRKSFSSVPFADHVEIGRPLRVACIGPNFRVGGVRQHALSLLKFLRPDVARIEELLVLDEPNAEAAVDKAFSVPVRTVNPQSLARLNDAYDVLLMWGNAFNNRLNCPNPIKIFIAHGETQWTRKLLVSSSEVVDHVIAVSESVFQKVCTGFPTTKILNGIDAGHLAQANPRDTVRQRFAFLPTDFVVGCVGRFTQEKRFDLLIRAVSLLPPHVKLLMVGQGRLQADMIELANQLIPGRFATVSARDYLGDYYQAMDAFGMVSAHEGFGLVLAEAMLSGRPVFSTAVGVAPEILIDRVNGVLVSPEPRSIASTIAMMQSNRAWSNGMAAQGRMFASQHFHASRMARDYESLMRRLYSERQATLVEKAP